MTGPGQGWPQAIAQQRAAALTRAGRPRRSVAERAAPDVRQDRDLTEGGYVPRKVRELIKIVEADGWYLVAQRGSHRQYKHMLKPGRVTIPGKPSKELYAELERSILRQAGLIGGDQ